MNEEKYCEILSTVEASQIQPDAGLQAYPQKTSSKECRICLQENGPFVIPCKCDGTMKYVHQKCLKKWAAKRLKTKVQKEEAKAKAKLSNIHGIQCELCKQTISMEVKKLKRLVGCSEAKQGSEEYFLPFVPLVILNTTIFLGCLGGASYIVAFGIMFAFFGENSEYDKYREKQYMIWGLLGLGFVFCSIFMAKSLIELYYMFVREQHEVIKVVPNPTSMTSLPKTTNHDSPKSQWFNNIEAISTPTSPQSINENLIHTKMSLNRKNMTLRRQINKELYERKRAKLQQFKADDINTNRSDATTLNSFLTKKIETTETENDFKA